MKPPDLKDYKIIDSRPGGMGVVYIAEDLALGRLVALKFLHSYLIQDRQLLERFRYEARNQARLNHPHITMVHSFQQTAEQAFIVMEYLDGETLEALLKRRKRLTAQEALTIFRPVCQAIHYAHSKGVVHRDLKPSNIGITTDGLVKVMDFGIALNLKESHRLTRTGHTPGTPLYMAPEQILCQPSDHRVDIYALGVTLYETLSGQPPFQGSDYEIIVSHINQPPASLLRLGHADITPVLENVVFKAMAKSADDRFASIQDFFQALETSLKNRSSGDIPAAGFSEKATKVAPWLTKTAPLSSPTSSLLTFVRKYHLPYVVLLLIAIIASPIIYNALTRGPEYDGAVPPQRIAKLPSPAESLAPAGKNISPPSSEPGTSSRVGLGKSVNGPGGPHPKSPNQKQLAVSNKPVAPTSDSPADLPPPPAPETKPPKPSDPPPTLATKPAPPPDLTSTETKKDTLTEPQLLSPNAPTTASRPVLRVSTPAPVVPETNQPIMAPATPPVNQENKKLVLSQAIKTKLRDSGFPNIEVLLQKDRIKVAGKVKNPEDRTRIIRLVNGMNLEVPMIFDDLTVIKKKPPKKTKKRTRSREDDYERTPVVEEPRTPLPPKFSGD
ncbi:serine/threonine protein kinase [Desulfobacca acetoxidans]